MSTHPATREDGAPPGGPDLVFIVRESGELLFENRDSPAGARNLMDRLSPESRERLADCVTHAFRHGRISRVEVMGLDPRDQTRWHDCRVVPNYRDGAVISATVAAHDITPYHARLETLDQEHAELHERLRALTADLEQARTTLAEQHETREAREQDWRRFRTLMDQAGEAIFVTDAATECIVDLNETACRWVRRQRGDVIGARAADLGLEFPVLVPMESELQFTETRDTRRPAIMGDHVHRRTDGTTFPVEVALARHRIGDKVFALAVVREVRVRRGAEAAAQLSAESYRRLFDQSWDPVFLTGRGGTIDDANRAAVMMFGYPREELIGLDARHLFVNPHDIRRFQVLMSAAAAAIEDLEVTLRTKDGLVFPALIAVARRPSPGRGIAGYQCVARPLAEPYRPVEAPPVDETAPRVLIASRGPDLAQARTTLRNAGMQVVSADAPDSAASALHESGGGLSAVILDADLGELRALLHDAAQHAPLARVIVLASGDVEAIRANIGDLGSAPVLLKPAHPLALLQRVRGNS
jgi:PAS domain S-box-containing protein